MIIIKLTGGIGNQMFQYALGRKLSIDKKTEFALDISWYEKSLDRRYLLDNFQISEKLGTKFEKIKAKFFANVKEKNFLFDPKIFHLSKNSYLDGYWQSPKYFEGIEDILQKDFTLKKPQGEKYDEMLRKIVAGNSVSLHVRRGDYKASKNVKIFADITPEYYQNAIVYIKEKIGIIHLFVFSDDVNWVKENLKIDVPTTFVSEEGFADYQELALMSNCKHNIIANSTFSWWASWLNSNKNKIVITPSKWFNIEEMSAEDFIPKTWVKI